MYQAEGGDDDLARAQDLSLLLTGGRLSTEKLNSTIVPACSYEPDIPSKDRCIQQLIVSTGKYHSTNVAELSGQDRTAEETVEADNSTTYKVSDLLLYHMKITFRIYPLNMLSSFSHHGVVPL